MLLAAASAANEVSRSAVHDTHHSALELAQVAFAYLDAKWKLFAGPETPVSVADDRLADVAAGYLDANWSVTEETSAEAEKTDLEVADEYLNANWALF